MSDRRCTASEKTIRCSNPAEGNSDLCIIHRDRCRKLYTRYKTICEDVPEFNACSLNKIPSMSIDELQILIRDTLEKHLAFQSCLAAREEHNKECYSAECRDEGHRAYMDKVKQSAEICDNLLRESYKRLQLEKDKIAQIQRNLEQLEEMDRNRAATSPKNVSSPSSKSRAARSKAARTIRSAKSKQEEQQENLLLEQAAKEAAEAKRRTILERLNRVDAIYNSIVDYYRNNYPNADDKSLQLFLDKVVWSVIMQNVEDVSKLQPITSKDVGNVKPLINYLIGYMKPEDLDRDIKYFLTTNPIDTYEDFKALRESNSKYLLNRYEAMLDFVNKHHIPIREQLNNTLLDIIDDLSNRRIRGKEPIDDYLNRFINSYHVLSRILTGVYGSEMGEPNLGIDHYAIAALPDSILQRLIPDLKSYYRLP